MHRKNKNDSKHFQGRKRKCDSINSEDDHNRKRKNFNVTVSKDGYRKETREHGSGNNGFNYKDLINLLNENSDNVIIELDRKSSAFSEFLGKSLEKDETALLVQLMGQKLSVFDSAAAVMHNGLLAQILDDKPFLMKIVSFTL